MIVIPAIDLLDGKCVRLRQGDYDQVTVYSEYPEEIALSFEQDGAELIHIVDLNGAKSGSPVNFKVVERIVKNISVPVEIGGGIRSIETAKKYADMGIKRIIIGTKACESPEFFGTLCREVGADIIAGIDAKDGKAAIQGWTAVSDKGVNELAKLLELNGAKGVIYTDVSKDGMRVGPNVEATIHLARSVNVPVIASGGVSCEDDILSFVKYAKDGIFGVIVGKAVYEGDLNLKSVIKKLEDMKIGNKKNNTMS